MRSQHSLRARTRWIGVATLLLVVATAAACSSDAAKGAKKPSTTTTPEGKVAFTVQHANIDSPGAEIPFADEIKAQLEAALNTWANAAVLTPLRTGKVGEVGSLFGAATAAKVAAGGADRPVFFETDLRAVKPVTVKVANADLTGLADKNGAVQLVNAQVALGLQTATKDGPVTINRIGNIVFVNGGTGWQVGYYDLAVARAGKGLGTAPTTSSAATTKGA